jgi:tetratricopeptide (TPR) repeat protein
MSIINKALQQIEESSQKNGAADSGQTPQTISMGSAFDNKYKSMLFNKATLAGVVVIILGIILATHYHSHPSPTNANNNAKKDATQLAGTTPVPQKPKSPFPAAKGAPSKLENISFNVDNNKTTVDFVLNKDASYYLERGKEPQQLKLVIGNSTYDKEWPMNLANTAIKKLSLQKVNDDTVVELEMAPDTQVVETQIYHQPQSPKAYLRLSLLNTKIQIGTVNKTVIPLTQQQRSAQAYQDALELINEGKNETAIAKLRETILTPQETPDAYELLATLLIKNKRLNEADKVLASANRTFPGHQRFEQLRAYVLVNSGKIGAALQLLLKNPPEITQDPDYYAFIASLYQQQGEYMLAAQLYNRILKIQPQRAVWWVGLGVSLEGAEKDNAAQEAYRRASALGDLSPQVQSFVDGKIAGK